MTKVPFVQSVFETLTFSGPSGRAEYALWLTALCLTWVALDVSYHWTKVFLTPLSNWPWQYVVACLVIGFWLSTMLRRLQDTRWSRWMVLIPLGLFGLPYFVWGMVLWPFLQTGSTYAEAMQGASQDRGIQIAVTGAGMINPMLAGAASWVFLLFPSRSRHPAIATQVTS